MHNILKPKATTFDTYIQFKCHLQYPNMMHK